MSTMDFKEEKLLTSPPRPSLASGSDRIKRDEWSEGAVAFLLEAYEAKWILRNRAKLKGQDWEDVARQVSSRASPSRSVKTATQCKNKIESMKKRYRNEVAAGSGSTWPLFSKLDGLVRCRGAVPLPASATLVVINEKPAGSCDHPIQVAGATTAKVDVAHARAQVLQLAVPNGAATATVATAAPQEGHVQREKKLQQPEMDKESAENAPSCDSSEENHYARRKQKKRRRAREEGWGFTESIRWFGEVILRVEQSRLETMREMEKIRAETEARKREMDLKQTEIIANTQLEIAKIFARGNDRVNSSARTERR